MRLPSQGKCNEIKRLGKNVAALIGTAYPRFLKIGSMLPGGIDSGDCSASTTEKQPEPVDRVLAVRRNKYVRTAVMAAWESTHYGFSRCS